MAEFHVGCALNTWKNVSAPAPDWDDVALREVGQAGHAGAPTIVGAGRSPEETVARYARHGLATAPGYFGDTFQVAERRDQILEQARYHARFMREVGCTELYIAAGGGDYLTLRGKTRRELAGQILPEDALPDDEFARYAALIDEIGAIALAEGVRACFHNHVGTFIETRAEMDRLLALTDPGRVFVGPDTGHLAWAGDDPAALCRDYAARIGSAHLKDCHAGVIAQGRVEGRAYPDFVRHGIVAELGEGCVDFPAIFQLLREADFAGWATALEGATVSRASLRGIGVGERWEARAVALPPLSVEEGEAE